MTERMRKILRGIGIAPKSADEIALVSAMQEMAEAVELPSVSGSDNGKLLGVSSGKWQKIDAPKELPAVNGDDDGKVLMVVDGAWAVGSLPTGET